MGCFPFLPSDWRNSDCMRRKSVSEGELAQDVVRRSADFRDDLESGNAVASESVGGSGGGSVQTSEPEGGSHDGAVRKPRELRVFSFAELKSATKNFHRQFLLGEGGFGCVYKGIIKQKVRYEGGEEKVEVAVKKLNSQSQQGHKEWLAEVHFLGLVDNPYVVKLIGYCTDDDETGTEGGIQRLLVYEFMPKRGLDNHLFVKGPHIIPWHIRVQIALGAARGLAYLHEELEFQVIFRDFKTSNVLLDEAFNPKLSDFGLARQGPEEGDSHVTTAVIGTIGYAAPEYIQTGHLTAKSDVWSFGVVMLELITGRRAMDRSRPKTEQRLVEWVRPYVTNSNNFWQVVDPQLDKYPLRPAMKFANIAMQCLRKYPKTRPKMSEVVQKLKSVLESTYLWEVPASQPLLKPSKASSEFVRPSPLQLRASSEPTKLPSTDSTQAVYQSSSPGSAKQQRHSAMHHRRNALSQSLTPSTGSPKDGTHSSKPFAENLKLPSQIPDAEEENSPASTGGSKKPLDARDRLSRRNREKGSYTWVPQQSLSS